MVARHENTGFVTAMSYPADAEFCAFPADVCISIRNRRRRDDGSRTTNDAEGAGAARYRNKAGGHGACIAWQSFD
jgi:hypothetical protein